MKKVACSIAILWVVLLFSLSSSFALEKPTHEAINEKIALGSFNGFSLDTYLKNYLGFINGTIEEVNSQKVFEWLKLGGQTEDEPMYTRSFNHFHDPMKPWDNAGLYGTFKSSIIWSQDQGWIGSQFGGDRSWKKARDNFYKGLTGITKTEREQNLADTFRALGQIMHLVQDASVPAHVRDDAHVVGYHYELAVENNIRNSKDPNIKKIFEDAVANPITFNPSILVLAPNTLAPIPIAKMFDTDNYTLTNPDPTVTLGSAIGLAEYTNANFFSEDTIFMNYPHPAYVDTNLLNIDWKNPEVVDAEDGKKDNRIYITKYAGEPVQHLAALSYISYDCIKKGYYQFSPLVLDEKVYEEYASKLIPRAVGYSAGLMNYFFRGTLDISPPNQYVYSITDGSAYHQQFTHIKAKVKNTTPLEKDTQGNILTYEPMQSGELHAVAQYKIISNYSPDLSNYFTDYASYLTAMQNVEYSYSVSNPIQINALSSTQASEFTFDFTSNPIPAGITDLRLIVFFSGTLGNEQDIAIAAGMKDLTEPMHHVFWNLSDMFSLYGHLYTSGQIKSDTDLAKLVDYDRDGIFNETSIGEPYIDPYNVFLDVGYFGGADPGSVVSVATVDLLPPGRFIELISLVEFDINNPSYAHHLRLSWTAYEPTRNVNSSYDFNFLGAVVQEYFPAPIVPTPVTTFRQIRQHFSTGVINCEPGVSGGICPYPENEAITPADLSPYPATILFP